MVKVTIDADFFCRFIMLCYKLTPPLRHTPRMRFCQMREPGALSPAALHYAKGFSVG